MSTSRKGSVLVVLELHFFNQLYSGVMDLQDKIFLQKRLGQLNVAGLAMESMDGKQKWPEFP